MPNTDGIEIKSCNCEKSKCLKLYCECFAKNQVCGDTCNCKDCHNNITNEESRIKAIQNTLEKNPEAFTKKSHKSEITNQGSHGIKGCTCK